MIKKRKHHYIQIGDKIYEPYNITYKIDNVEGTDLFCLILILSLVIYILMGVMVKL